MRGGAKIADTSPRSELREGAPLLAVAFTGLLLSVGVLTVYPFGMFFAPLQAAFGWTRTELSAALSIATITMVVAGPVHGALIDRFGARPLLLVSTVGLGASLGSLFWLGPSLPQFYLAFAAAATFGASASPIGYSRLLVAAFDKRRGLALGLALSGAGLGAALLPPFSDMVIRNFGWRGGYLALGALALSPALLCLFVLRGGGATRKSISGPAPVGSVSSLPPRWVLPLLALIFALMGVVSIGVFTHVVPLLTDRGMDRSRAASLAGLMGVAVVLGRVAIGWLMDHTSATRILAVVAVSLAAACALFAQPLTGSGLLVAAIVLGFGLGAEVDLLSYLVSRYWPATRFGSCYGRLYAAFTLGAGCGPLLIASAFDRQGDYVQAMNAAAVVAALAALLSLRLPRLGPTSTWSPPAARENAAVSGER